MAIRDKIASKRKAVEPSQDASSKRSKKITAPLPAFLLGEDDDAMLLPRGRDTASTAVKSTTATEPEKGLFVLNRKPQSMNDDSDDDEAEVDNMPAMDSSVTYGDAVELKSVHSLTLNKLAVGSVVLGSIKSIADLDMVISLPDGLTGFVSLREISDTMATLVDDYIANGDAVNDSESDDDEEKDSSSKGLPELAQMYSIGQLVRVVVVKVATQDNLRKKAHSYKRIELSMRPSLFNTHIKTDHLKRGFLLPGAIKSSEEKGFVVDIGMNNITGFLPKTSGKKYTIGQTIDVAVATAPRGDTRVISLTDDLSNSVKSAISTNSELPLDAIKPGALIKVSIHNTLLDGLVVRLLGSFQGTVSLSHIDRPVLSSIFSLGDMFTINSTVVARVLYSNALTKTVMLSLRPSIVHKNMGFQFPSWVTPGQVIEKARIIRNVRDHGIMIDLTDALTETKPADAPELTGPVLGWIHINDLTDSKIDTIPKHMKPNKFISIRVTSPNPMEAAIVCSARPSILSAQVLRRSDIIPGEIYNCEVVEAKDKVGLIIRVNPTITALVPILHLRDTGYGTNYDKILTKYKNGSKHDFRCLVNDSEKHKLVFTAKPSMVKTTLPIITSIEEATAQLAANPQGLIVDGFISRVTDEYVVVGFLNGVAGTCSASELMKSGSIVEGQKISESFTLGQSVRVRVAFVKGTKLVVSFQTTMLAKKKMSPNAIQYATWVSAKVTGMLADKSGLSVTITTGDKTSDAVLPIEHLTDINTNAHALLNVYAETEPEFLALVVGRQDNKPIVTIKPMLLAAAAELDIKDFLLTLTSANIADFNSLYTLALKDSGAVVGSPATMPAGSASLAVGESHIGVISRIVDYGVFVQIGRASVLVAKASVADSFVDKLDDFFTVGQTVRLVILEVKEDGESVRVSASIKPSVVNKSGAIMNSLYSAIFFAEQALLASNDVVARVTLDGEDAVYVAPTVAVGSIFNDTKVSKPAGSTITFTAPKVTATLQAIAPFHTMGSSIADGAVKGAVAASRVIDVDPVTGVASLSLRPSVVDAFDTVSKKKGVVIATSAASACSLKSGATVQVEVLQRTRNYVVVGLVEHKFSLAVAVPCSSNKPAHTTTYLVPGYRTTATVVCPPSSSTDRLLVTLALDDTAKRTGAVPEGTFFSMNSLNDFQANTPVKVKVGAYDAKKNTVSVLFGPEGPYNQVMTGQVSLSSIIDYAAPSKSKSKKVAVKLQSVLAALESLTDSDDLIDAKITKTGRGNGTVSIPGLMKPLSQRLVQVTLRPSDVEDDAYLSRGNVDDYPVGSSHQAVVTHVSAGGIIAEFTPALYATIRPTAITSDHDLLASVTDYIKVGDVITTKITYSNCSANAKVSKQYIHAALVHNKLNSTGVDSNKDFSRGAGVKVGAVVENVVVSSYDSHHAMFKVSLGGLAVGRLPLAELSDIFQEDVTETYQPGDIIPCVAVLAELISTGDHPHYVVSTRESRLAAAIAGELDVPEGQYNPKAAQDASTVETFDPMQVSDVMLYKDLAEGQLLHGYISYVGPMGAFVQLSGLLSGRVQLKELSERFITNIHDNYKVGQLLPVRVLKLNAEKATIELTAKRSVVSAANLRVMEMLKPGMVVKGRVVKVTPELGVFIAIKHCTLRGLAYKTECVDNKAIDFSSHYVIGDKVKAVVLRVNAQTQKISLGLKASLFQKLDKIAASGRTHTDATDEMVDEDEDLEDQAKYSDDEDSSEDEFEEKDIVPRSTAVTAAKPLVVQTKHTADLEAEAAPSLFSSLVFSAPVEAEEDDEEEELVPMDGDEEADVLSRRAAKEREIERSERAIMDESKPMTAEEHEMSCVRSPNNSYIWIQYMAYELGQGNTVQARDIANRALKAISVHETQERWNIWAAMLSLENVYGTVDSINDVVKRAQKLNNPLKVQLELARIYDMSTKVDRAADAYSVAAKRWGADFNDHAVEIWTLWSAMLFKYNRIEEARKVLNQAIQKLNTKYHAPVLIKFAQLEFQDNNGSPDRARMLLEKYLSAHSKRLDVWIIYVDQEIKHARTLAAKVNAKPGDVKKAKSRIRALFDRLTAESQWKIWTIKQMKFIFKKYLDCEEELGTADRVSAVQDKARIYVSSITTA